MRERWGGGGRGGGGGGSGDGSGAWSLNRQQHCWLGRKDNMSLYFYSKREK